MTSLCPLPYHPPPLYHLWHSSDPTVSQFREKTRHFLFSMFLLYFGTGPMPGLGQGKRKELCSCLHWAQLSCLVQVGHHSCYLRTCRPVFPCLLHLNQSTVQQETHLCLLTEAGGSSCCSNYSHSTESCQTAPLKLNLSAGIFLTSNGIIIDTTHYYQLWSHSKMQIGRRSSCAGISILVWLLKPR